MPTKTATTKSATPAAKLDLRPVVFTSSVGTLWVEASRHKPLDNGGLLPIPGLRVVFTPTGDGHGEPIGGFSRPFYPDLLEHDEDSDSCDCAGCLQKVREFIANRRNAAVVNAHHVREVDPDAGVKIPYSKWDGDLSVGELPKLWESVGFDLDQALRYERKNLNRPSVIKALEDLILVADDVTEDDVLSAEVELD